jgi:enterochelin esterase-like enzyme
MRNLLLFFIFIKSIIGISQVPQVESGKIIHYENFESKFTTKRNVAVWLPEGYSSNRKYSVLYMHDGQMLFDSNITWNKQAWEVDRLISKYTRENKIKDVIVVGIWNGGSTRHADYFPQKTFELLNKLEKDSITACLILKGKTKSDFKPVSDNYLKFLVKELKPFVDKTYSTYTGKKHTFIMGSSMGGLISMYAICEYPKVFGGAACLSTHWTGIFTLENNPIPNAFLNYLQNHLPSPRNNKIYFDCGDQTLDSLYPDIQRKVDEIMVTKKFNKNSWATHYFPGENHSENAWKKRLGIPVLFLLKK